MRYPIKTKLIALVFVAAVILGICMHLQRQCNGSLQYLDTQLRNESDVQVASHHTIQTHTRDVPITRRVLAWKAKLLSQRQSASVQTDEYVLNREGHSWIKLTVMSVNGQILRCAIIESTEVKEPASVKKMVEALDLQCCRIRQVDKFADTVGNQ